MKLQLYNCLCLREVFKSLVNLIDDLLSDNFKNGTLVLFPFLSLIE